MSIKSIFSTGSLFLGLSIFCLLSCSKDADESGLFVDEELQVYFDLFETEGATRGHIIDLSTSNIEGYLQQILNSSVAGQCAFHEDKPNRVTIDLATWLNYSDLEKEYLVFHELGHCYLERGHRDQININGTCVSIMQSGTINCRSNYTLNTRESYLDELFE